MSLNRYVYARDNPGRYADPNGHVFISTYSYKLNQMDYSAGLSGYGTWTWLDAQKVTTKAMSGALTSETKGEQEAETVSPLVKSADLGLSLQLSLNKPTIGLGGGPTSASLTVASPSRLSCVVSKAGCIPTGPPPASNRSSGPCGAVAVGGITAVGTSAFFRSGAAADVLMIPTFGPLIDLAVVSGDTAELRYFLHAPSSKNGLPRVQLQLGRVAPPNPCFNGYLVGEHGYPPGGFGQISRRKVWPVHGFLPHRRPPLGAAVPDDGLLQPGDREAPEGAQAHARELRRTLWENYAHASVSHQTPWAY